MVCGPASPAWFSRHGTLLATAEAFIRNSVAGYFAEELSAILHIGAQDVLRQLVQRKRIARELISGLFLYTSMNPVTRQQQRLTRRGNQSVPTVVDASRLEVSPDEMMKAAIILFCSLLDEQQRRLYAALESMKLGHGGDQRASRISWPRSTHHRPRPPAVAGSGCRGRPIRQPGAGRKPVEKTPEVIEAIEILLEHDTAGDPITGIRWTHKTPAGIAELLRQLDIQISANTVARLLRNMDFSLRVNRKAIATDSSPDRDQQFRYISSLRTRFERQGLPIISVDTKKRELVGNFKNNGDQVGSNARAR